MNITFFRHSLLSRGGDKMIVAHANHLVAAGHDVCIITALKDTVFVLDPRILIQTLTTTSKLGTILSAIRGRWTSDAVIADIIPMACFLFVRNRKRIVYFAQDYDESYYTSPFLKILIRCLYGVGLKLFRIPTIAVSLPLAELLRTRFNARVTVAENGVDIGVFFPDPDPALVRAKLHRKAVLLLSRRDQRKGFDIAQDVVKRLTGSYSELSEIWTVGEPCAGLFPARIHHDFGYVGEERLRRIMSSADMFFYPTRHEGFPLMPLEAMVCGCPVVTTAAVPYAIQGDNALVSQIGDNETLLCHLRELLDNDDLCSGLSEAGKKFARSHALGETTREFETGIVGIVQK
jgi:glycosyltransferase involved in cell wall biosynthesis